MIDMSMFPCWEMGDVETTLQFVTHSQLAALGTGTHKLQDEFMITRVFWINCVTHYLLTLPDLHCNQSRDLAEFAPHVNTFGVHQAGTTHPFWNQRKLN